MNWLSFTLGALSVVLLLALVSMWWVPFWRHRVILDSREALENEAKVVAKEHLQRQREAFEASLETTRTELKDIEDRCRLREDALDRRQEAFDDRERELVRRESELNPAQATFVTREAEVERTHQRQLRELERISGMRREEAEHMLLDRMEQEFQREAEEVLARAEETLEADLQARARDSLLTALERLAGTQVQEALVSVVPLARDELKQQLIGREGRNARAFEIQTGVDLLIDDTPGVVVLSAFEPVRREIARRALVRLLDEGRIHPQRIEEVVAETRQDMEEVVARLGEAAADATAVTGLHSRLLTLLGRLEFRTSEGRNVRRHAIETAQLAGTLASELGLEPGLARRCGLLINVGKAVEHGVEGSHARVGADFARRCNEKPLVVNAIAAHHGEEEPSSPYAVLAAVASTACARRPGAGDERVEHAVRRHEEVEAIASKHSGVKRCYAVQAGRELRVIVDPAKISEKGVAKLAREIAKQVEEAAVGPGEVTVTVIREVRHEEIAG